ENEGIRIWAAQFFESASVTVREAKLYLLTLFSSVFGRRGGGKGIGGRLAASPSFSNGSHSGRPSSCTGVCASTRSSASHWRSFSPVIGPYCCLSRPMTL